MSITVQCSSGHSTTALETAILLYGNGKEINFVSLHDVKYINNDFAKPYIGPGKPASKMALTKLLEDLSPETVTKRTLIPENVLSYDTDHLVWYTLPTKRQLWFKSEQLGGKVTANVEIPGLVFYVYQNAWYVFAHKLKKRPSADTPLFVSPFLNVWEQGKICTGNIKLPKIKGPESTLEFEDAFFRSYFTHINIHGKDMLVKYEGGPYKLWKQLITGEITKFPMKALVSNNQTVGAIFNQLNKDES